MLYKLAIVLFVLWFVGVVTSHIFGGFVHILLALAIVAVFVRLIGHHRKPDQEDGSMVDEVDPLSNRHE